MDSTALLTAIIGAAYGAMIAYRLLKGQRWTAVGLTACGSIILLNLVTMGARTRLEHRVLLVLTVALSIIFMAVLGRVSQEQQRGLIDTFWARVRGGR